MSNDIPSSQNHNFDIEMVIDDMIQVNVTISCFYVPPNSSNEYHDLVLSELRFLCAKPRRIITGDFNSPDLNWSTFSASSPFSISFCKPN